jgi:hypothetical protein
MITIKNKREATQWSVPLKLIAAALTDLGKIGTPSQIRESLGRHHVLGNRKWESWWKLVQPEHLTKISVQIRISTDSITCREKDNCLQLAERKVLCQIKLLN